VKFAEDKVLVSVILHAKCYNSATQSLTVILTLISRADWSDINRTGIVERLLIRCLGQKVNINFLSQFIVTKMLTIFAGDIRNDRGALHASSAGVGDGSPV